MITTVCYQTGEISLQHANLGRLLLHPTLSVNLEKHSGLLRPDIFHLQE